MLQVKDTKVDQKAMVFAYDNDEYIPSEIIENTSRPYTTFLKGKTTHTGLSFEEQINCPQLIGAIGVAVSSPDFTEEQNEFWSDWKYDIPICKYNPKTGKADNSIVIDAGYSIIDGKLIVNDLNDFILFRIMSGDVQVGKSERDYEDGKSEFDYFLFDLNHKEALQLAKIKLKGELTKRLADIIAAKDSESLIKQILLVSKKYSYGEVSSLDAVTAVSEIFTFSENEPQIFLETSNKPDLAERALVRRLVENGIINEIGSTYYFGDEQIGNGSAILTYIKSPANKVAVERMKDQLESNKLIDAIS